ncbi:MAG: hypothetical protein MK052_04780 [Alphaproteobacteria bacterium]|nr:hypothetical protein [Alphaproteobacteria bacterium]
MYERLINIVIMFTLSVVAFTLVAFGFNWVYQLWLVDAASNQWVLPLVAIPSVAVISALLIYLFVFALSIDDEENISY